MHTPINEGSPFRRLRVWNAAVELAAGTYRVTALWPREERFGLTAQVRRAAISVVANIAEDSARRGTRSFHQFLQIAFGSIKELEALLVLSAELGSSTEASPADLLSQLSSTSKQLPRLLQRVATPERVRSPAD